MTPALTGINQQWIHKWVFNPIHGVVYVDVNFIGFLKEYVATGI